MKRCKQCNRAYDDDSLSFCLEDGTVLVRVTAEPPDPYATVPYSDEVVPPPTVPLKTPLSRTTQTVSQDVRPTYTRRLRGNSSSNRVLTVAVVGIGLVLLGIAAILVVFLWRQMRGDQSTAQSPGNDGQLAVSATSPNVNSQSTSTLTPNIESENFESQKKLKINVTASSVRYSVQSNTYFPANVIDGSRQTAWIEGADGPGLGEWLLFDFGRDVTLHRVIVLPGYFKSSDIWKLNNRLARATLYFSDGTSRLVDFPDRMERQSLDLGPVKTRWVRLEIAGVHSGTDPDTAISEVVFEWE